MHVRKGDTVVVITGKDAGKEGKILTAMPKENRVIVEGVNVQHRHTKPRSAQQTGGILDKAGPIDASNVMLLCPNCKKGVRVGHTVDEQGNKHRVCKKCGNVLDAAKEAVKKDVKEKEPKKAPKKKAEKKPEPEQAE